MKKTVRLGTLPKDGDVFCKIEITDGKLSICGVEGPKSNGDCRGACGQIAMHLKADDITPAPGWDEAKIRAFLELWDRWHLNDMRAGCEHQRQLNTTEKITLFYFRLSPAVTEARRDARKMAEGCIEKGESFTPTAEQTRLAKLGDKITHDAQALPPELARDYVPNAPRYTGDSYNRPSEEKLTCWVYPHEHPKGLLTKSCTVCGYKYGSQWLREELPAEVVTFLQSLPDTDKTPAWV